MLFKRNAPPPPGYVGPALFLFSFYPFWEAWSVVSRGGMEAAHCNGLFAGSLCRAGLWVGTAVFGQANAYLGYALVLAGFGVLFLYLAYGSHRRFKAGQLHGQA